MGNIEMPRIDFSSASEIAAVPPVRFFNGKQMSLSEQNTIVLSGNDLTISEIFEED